MPFILGDPPTGHQFSTITLDNSAGVPVDLHKTTKRHIYRATGLLGVTPPRQVIRPRPSAHGAINDTRNTDGRLIVLEGRILSLLSAADLYNEFYTVAGTALETLDEGPALLKWTADGGLALQALVKLHDELEPPVEAGPNFLVYQAQFFAEDPRAYSQTEVTATGAALAASGGGFTFARVMPFTFDPTSTGGLVAVSNEGNRPTPPVFRVYGACVNPQITQVDGTGRIALTGTISAGDYMEIDVAGRTIRLNGTSPALNFLDASATTWFELAKGTSTLQLSAASFDATARLDVIYRAAYT